MPPEPLNKPQLIAGLSETNRSKLSTLEIYNSLDSTNRYLMDYARDNSKTKISGMVCFAEQQTAGKGRRGRQWQSPFGNNLYFSLLWQFPHGYTSTTGLSLAVGVAVMRALKPFHSAQMGLKWPNDIVCNGKKLGGILIEMAGDTGGACTAVIGIGLNVFLSDSEAKDIYQPWTDLTRVTGQTISRNTLASALVNALFHLLADFETTPLTVLLDEWRNYDVLRGQSATLFIGGQCIHGIVEGINEQGLLRLKRSDGSIQTFASGEISFSS